MTKFELIRKITAVMRDNNIRKPVSSKKHVFHISDDDGNTKDFTVKESGRDVIFTTDDVEAVIETCIAVVEDALKNGDCVSIKGFGSLGLQYRKARRTKHPTTGEIVEIAAHYIPKFAFGNGLRRCANLFELSLENTSVASAYDMPPDDEDGDVYADRG